MSQPNESNGALQKEPISATPPINADNVPSYVSPEKKSRSNKVLITLILAIIVCTAVIFSRNYPSGSEEFPIGMSYEKALAYVEKNYADSYTTRYDDGVNYILLSTNDFWGIENAKAVSILGFDSDAGLFTNITSISNDSSSSSEFKSLILDKFFSLHEDYEAKYIDSKYYLYEEDNDLEYMLIYDIYEETFIYLASNSPILNKY